MVETVFPILVSSFLLFLENRAKEFGLEVPLVGFQWGKRFQSLLVASLEGHGVNVIGCLNPLTIIGYDSLRILFLERG